MAAVHLRAMIRDVQRIPDEPNDGTAMTSSTTEERGGPGLRDAHEVLARIEADEVAAAAARQAGTLAAFVEAGPDGVIDPELRHGERVVARREAALMNRLDGSPMPGYAGRLYLTDQRLIHTGQGLFSLALSALEEVSVVGERLLLTLVSGEGVSFDVAQPRLLRAQIGLARTADRG